MYEKERRAAWADIYLFSNSCLRFFIISIRGGSPPWTPPCMLSCDRMISRVDTATGSLRKGSR